ncbi:PGPGW domain-containing protein [Nitrospira sp. BLG_2]|uniref:PGPGW domain-containing protein n=1 Tax=Nitrospira sp. BLG_2 TaxID=3397507 RepID=UPI003B9BA8DD
MDGLLSAVQQYISTETLVTLTALSMVFFVGSLIAIPFILVRLPTDFFDTRVPRRWMEDHHPVLRLLGHIVKNVIGAIFLFVGFLMLFLPGQGILTMLIGVTMLDFPGKRKMEAKMIGQPAVLSTINNMRQKFGQPPLTIAPKP